MSEGHSSVSHPAPEAKSKICPPGFIGRVVAWCAGHPGWALVIVSLLAVVISCYPIIFCNRSYVSPMNSGGALAYGWWAPAPAGGHAVPSDFVQHRNNTHGSDTYATMWWGVPMGLMESHSLLERGEFPLWNRYSHAGDTLIGQAVSMLGDPLQLIVIFGQGSAWAWDIKFLSAKLLFCIGFGLLIRRIMGSQALALIYAALAAYSGAFFFINNHPAFFVFAYAPWILLAATAWLDLSPGRHLRWGLIWLAANFACFNAGHVELAVDLIGGLNLAALAYALSGCGSMARAMKVLARSGAGTLCFLGLTAPVWISFLVSAEGSFSAHQEVTILQLVITSLPGAFDELFYRALRANDTFAACAPGTSLLILVGCIISIWRWRQLKAERFFWVNWGAITLWGGCIFGCVPAVVLAKIPLLNNVGHLDTDLSYLLVIHLTIQSAYGFKCLAKVQTFREVGGDLACIGSVFAGMILLYSLGPEHRPIAWDYVVYAALGAVAAPLLFVYLKFAGRQSVVGWAGIVILGFIPNFRFGLYDRGNDALLMLPGPRVTLNAPSAAIDKLKAGPPGPFRIVGLEWAFMGDYSAAYELENIFSCAPLSNQEYINLIRFFPGMAYNGNWDFSVNDPDRAQPLLSLLNVKYLLSSPDAGTDGKLHFSVVDRSDFAVFENPQVWPRAFFANHVVSIASNGEFIQYLVNNGSTPFVAVSPSEIETHPGLREMEDAGRPIISAATNFRLSANATEFDIHAPSVGVVCLTEGQARDFKAFANHQPKAVLTVNRAFKGIYLDQPGDYHVQFIYRPRHWRLACSLFGIALTAVVLSIVITLFRSKPVPPSASWRV